MDSYWESQAMSLEDHDEIPITNQPVTILGKQYSALYDREEIRSDIISRIWCTYRRNFSPVGSGGGYTSDAGWGCMHRCGQMMLAQALIMIHLSREWRWYYGMKDSVYEKILSMFYDNWKSTYSIQRISLYDEGEKSAGKWFGPNTVAQALKKLSVNDSWTNIVIHVTMENGIIIDEIVAECKNLPQYQNKNSNNIRSVKKKTKQTNQPYSAEIDGDCVEVIMSPVVQEITNTETLDNSTNWRPLLLIVPVRLGLNELNPCYISSLKEILQIPECVGILGGRPSHALWFIGQVGDDFIYLDPHESQTVVKNVNKSQIVEPVDDYSYHCTRWGYMPISRLDPSLAFGFVVPNNREQLLNMCEQLKRKVLIPAGDHPMFEIHQKRPYYFPPFSQTAFSINENDGSEEEYELL